ncbi:hypothetical protein K1719_045944 [Acacia pycnantha]|nr:hypothetical protein K1719_045944 [Acacia pycnantha]
MRRSIETILSQFGLVTWPLIMTWQFPSITTLVHLPNLETVIIEDMPELMTIWHPFFTSSCLDNLKMMQVSNCGKLENIFPSYMQRAFASLETLRISDLNSKSQLNNLSSHLKRLFAT